MSTGSPWPRRHPPPCVWAGRVAVRWLSDEQSWRFGRAGWL